MENLIQESQIFGPTSTFCYYPGLKQITLEIHENFQKRTSRSRYFILSANGPQMLSIPLCKGKNNQQLISDVKIAYDEDWCRRHLIAIKSAYGKSPYFDFYYADIEAVFLKKFTFLFELNFFALQLMLKLLRLNIEIVYTTSYHERSINAEFLIHEGKPESMLFVNYSQVWQEKYNFTPNLSILDLLFCTGPEAVTILKRMNALC